MEGQMQRCRMCRAAPSVMWRWRCPGAHSCTWCIPSMLVFHLSCCFTRWHMACDVWRNTADKTRLNSDVIMQKFSGLGHRHGAGRGCVAENCITLRSFITSCFNVMAQSRRWTRPSSCRQTRFHVQPKLPGHQTRMAFGFHCLQSRRWAQSIIAALDEVAWLPVIN